MVSCPACGRDLPYDCRCCRTKEERLDAYLRQMARELELVKRVISGFRPTIEVAFFDGNGRELGREKCLASVVEVDDFEYELRVRVRGARDAAAVEMTLYGADGQILFRRRVMGWFPDEVEVSWRIGVPRKVEG
ncbi:MAG: hypothetical protein LM580_11295 [Thermofilum sp.]|nr:hypothetical protein [Thermofilum sp.]